MVCMLILHVQAHNSYSALIGVHGMHDQMHAPQLTNLLAHDPSHHWPTLYMITRTPLVAGN